MPPSARYAKVLQSRQKQRMRLYSSKSNSLENTKRSISVPRPPSVVQTDLPIIDEYYDKVDNEDEISEIQFRAIYLRLTTKLESLWRVKKTGQDEKRRIRGQLRGRLEQIDMNQTVEARMSEKMFLVKQIEKYIKKIDQFYEFERVILNLHHKRASLVQELVLFSLNMNIEAFQNYGVRLMLSIRQTTVRLLHNLKKRNAFLLNSKVFYTPDAQECILCLANVDKHRMLTGGMVLRKVQFFLENMWFFIPKSDEKVDMHVQLLE